MISEILTTSHVFYCDEIGMIIKKQGSLFMCSQLQIKCYFFHPRREFKAMEAIGIFPNFKGTAVHDGLKILEQL